MKVIVTHNPYNGKKLKEYEKHSSEEVDIILQKSQKIAKNWKNASLEKRCSLLSKLAALLMKKQNSLSELMTKEMGKPIAQSKAEIEKCAWVCDFYAKNAADFLADAMIETSADESFISYDPLGTVLAIMPWNYPFWQVMRFAAPTLTSGNTAILKHAENVTGCALAIEELFIEAGYPKGCFQTILASHEEIERIIGSKYVQAVSLTGSEKAGISIAQTAGKNLKKVVLELGGNNACVVWEDANLDAYIDVMVKARMQNAGQSCIAAKRFIVVEDVYDNFISAFVDSVERLQSGNPMDESVYISSMAREDLAESVEKQVNDSILKGAKVILGGNRKGAFFEPTIISEVTAEMPVFKEEVFGPVAAIVKVKNREEAMTMAADSRFGLGTMLFTQDIESARKMVGQVPDGAFFINEMVKSDPRLPFGGTKKSGFGRELSKEGILEFVNKKTVYLRK